MKIVIAMDSFKGSMTSMEAGNAAKEGVLTAVPDAEVIVRPLADGGEGTMAALVEGLGGEMVSVQVSDPLGRRITANYAIVDAVSNERDVKEKAIKENAEKTAVIEMAQAAGLILLTEVERKPHIATTYGVGEMICDAMDRGCRDFIVGIGGSATNDGGMGMLRALGYQFFDENEKEIPRECSGVQALSRVRKICTYNRRKELNDCTFHIACDVTNPLCGKNGATYIYGPQKGLAEGNLRSTDAAMSAYADAVAQFKGKDCRNIPGAGAAGGMGFAFVSLLGGKLMPGAELVMHATGLGECLKDADLFLTGEGRMDAQTAMGKGPVTAAQKAKAINPKCRVMAFAGQVLPGAEICLGNGIDEMHAITPEDMKKEQAMEKDIAKKNMTEAVHIYVTWQNVK